MKKPTIEIVEINDADIELLNKQCEVWSNYLNNASGILSFSLALACLGTHSPSINAFLSIFIILIFAFSSAKTLFPQKIKELRVLAKQDEKYKIYLDGIEKKYFSFFISIKRYPIYFFGFFFLMFVAFSSFLSKIFPSISLYVNGT